MQQFEWIHAAWLAVAIVLEIIANVFLKFSIGCHDLFRTGSPRTFTEDSFYVFGKDYFFIDQ